jgi:dienelactone hydrolase
MDRSSPELHRSPPDIGRVALNRSPLAAKLVDAPGVCHEDVIFIRVIGTDFVQSSTNILANFRAGRLAPGARVAALPPFRQLLGNASLPRELVRTRAQADSLAAAMKSDGRTILLLPGLLASEARMEPLRAVLNAAGYDAHGWGMGRNFGPKVDSLEQIDRRVDAIRRETGRSVTLVGWSLGGLFAREYAKFATQKVAGVITMGTPFSGDPRANRAWRLYQLVSGHPVDRPPFACTREAKPPVPTIALWSARDGVVLPECAAGRAGERDRAVRVDCTHMGFAAAPEGIAAVGRALEALRVS